MCSKLLALILSEAWLDTGTWMLGWLDAEAWMLSFRGRVISFSHKKTLLGPAPGNAIASLKVLPVSNASDSLTSK